METSIILRTKNEEKWIGECLKRIFSQTYKDFEVIVVDSGSTDKTLEIAKKFPARIFHIKPEKFTYPYALNFGCRKAKAKKYFVILSAHSLPISNTWLEDGLKNFRDKKVMGIYGSIRTLPDASLTEKLFFNVFIGFIDIFKKCSIIKKKEMGLLGFTNAIIRGDLWEKHNFDERYELGGEDTAWADYWIHKGYVAIRDVHFTVQHSHELGFIKFLKQFSHWNSVLKGPQPFKKLEFRNKN